MNHENGIHKYVRVSVRVIVKLEYGDEGCTVCAEG